MTQLCRVLLLLAFALFWGGLTFYTGFAVRISHAVLSDPMEGGLITQRVTGVLQICGFVTVGLMLWNAAQVGKTARRNGLGLAGCASVLAVTLVGLVLVHNQLDAVIDVASYEITDRVAFTLGHQRYNQLTTLEWLVSLAYLILTVIAWRRVDTRSPHKSASAPTNLE